MDNTTKRRNILPLFLIVIGIILGGIAISISGIFFTTKYFESPQDAFYEGWGSSNTLNAIDIVADIGMYSISTNSAVYLAETSEGELLMVLMKVKDQKYASYNYCKTVNLSLLDTEDESASLNGTKWVLSNARPAEESKAQAVQEFFFDEDIKFYIWIPNK